VQPEFPEDVMLPGPSQLFLQQPQLLGTPVDDQRLCDREDPHYRPGRYGCVASANPPVRLR
jgi:hypothetical protein